MAGPPTADDYESVVATAEATSPSPFDPLSPHVYFEDLIHHHLEEAQANKNLLHAAETEYSSPRALSPTEYYNSVPRWKPMDSGNFHKLSSSAMHDGSPIIEGTPPSTGMGNPFAQTKTEEMNSIMQLPDKTPTNQIDHGRGSNSSTAMLVQQVLDAVEEDFASMIELTIPENGKKVVIHEHLLCEVSKFFAARRAACKDFGSSKRQRETFPVRDYSPNIEWDSLLVFVNWIYFNKLYDHVDCGDDNNSPGWNDLLDLYFLAVKWEITVLKNLLLDLMIEAFRVRGSENEEFPCDYTKSIYEHTNKEDPLRRLWIDFYMSGISGEEFEKELKSNELDMNFVKDLSLSFIIGGFDGDQPPLLDEPAAYHASERETGVCCCRTRFEGDQYRHKCDFTRRDTDFREAAHGRIRSLEYELQKTLDDKDKEISKEQAKIQDLENQLSQSRNTNAHSQAQAKRIADLEAAARKTQTLMSQAQSARDKDANAARTRITNLENQLRVKTKEVDDQKQEVENAKKRKLDVDWRSGR